MNIRMKLFASLGKYLPEGSGTAANGYETELTVVEGATVTGVINQVGVPAELCHLVLVNGVYVAPGERDSKTLSAEDILAIWPPIAGG